MASVRNLVLLLSIGCLAACGQQDATTEAADASAVVLNRGNGGEPGTLDPHRNEEDGGGNILRDLYEGLTTEDVAAQVVPGAAESWEISADGLVYTFKLRDNARWSNGDPVVAEDFVAGLRRTVDPATASTYAQILYPIANAQAVAQGELPPEQLSIRALDAQRLEITLAAPTPYFLGLLSHSTAYPIHRPSLATHGGQFARAGNLVSNGPYRLTEWAVQSHIKLERNTHYWDNANVQIDTVYYHATEDIDAELRRYRAGELDFTYQIPNTQYRWIQENLPGELQTAPYISVYFYGLDLTEPPFDDVRLRQALSMAIDRETITEQVTGLGQVPAFNIVPPGVSNYPGSRYSWESLPREQQLAEARRLYREAGYSENNPLSVEIRYNTSDNHQRIAVAVASMWKTTLGIETRLLNEEFRVLLQSRLTPSVWEIIRFGWFGDYNDAYTFLEIFRSDHGQNFMGYEDAEYDRLTAAATEELDTERRRDLMLEAEARMLAAYPMIPIYFYVSRHLVKPYVIGYQPNIMNRTHTRHLRVDRN
jgi:oligopeptide transport system substrate-binding protein